ncbi:glycosyltransferase family 4 protein [bacterium]|nr:glycosyltransferase family 4 protein [bacterium]
MKIGVDASCLPPFVAGAGRYICGLVSALSQVDSINEYFIFAKKRDLELFNSLGPNFTKVGLADFHRPARIAWQFYQPGKLVKEFQLDVWHAPHYILPKNLDNIRSVVTFHDMTFFRFPEFYRRHKTWFFKKVISETIKRANAIVAVSETTKSDIECLFGQLSNRVVQVYSGTNGRFNPYIDQRAESEIKSRLKTGDRFVLFVGTLEKRKNVTTLIRAFSHLFRKGHADLRLVVAGQPENAYREIRNTIADLGLSEHVILPGYVPEGDLPALYSAAAVFVYPSHYEGFGFPVLEAMASGTPTITSNNSGMREITALETVEIDPGDELQLAQKIERVLCDTEYRQEIIAHGLRRSKELTWEKTARNMLDVYQGTSPNSSTYSNSPVNSKANGRQFEPKSKNFDPERRLAHHRSLRQSVLETLVYSDLFDYPLTVSEIHRDLIAHEATLPDIERALGDPNLDTLVEARRGFVFLRGKRKTVVNRECRERISSDILFKNRRWLKLVSHFPFVRGAALSGAIAFKNCVPGDDIDLFLIVDTKRLWTVYFLLAATLKFLGKRNLICLNYLFGKADLLVDPRNFFVAHQIAHLRPLSGSTIFQEFFDANRWVLRYLPQASGMEGSAKDFYPLVRNRLTPFGCACKDGFEKILNLKWFDKLEDWTFRLYGQHIKKITSGETGSISVERDQIRLFTNDHRFKVLHKFQKRLSEVEELKT